MFQAITHHIWGIQQKHRKFDGTQKFDAKRSANVFGFILLGDVSDNFWTIFWLIFG